MHFRRQIIFVFLCFLTAWLPASVEGQLTIYADTQQNDTLRQLTAVLKQQLEKAPASAVAMAAASQFNGKGILITLSSEATKIKPPAKLLSSGTEGYYIHADGSSVTLLGNSNLALGHAVFTWLETLGYRYYFANPDWHIIPRTANFYKKLDTLSGSPSFAHRKIFYGYGTGSTKADADFVFWQLANKIGGTLNAIYGHSYDNIMLRNAAAFKAHPEWFYPAAKPGTLPESPKFDMSNEQLVQVVIQDVMRQIETSLKDHTQSYKMITLGPSDGPGTCNTPACQKLGTITDRVFYLVNRVASAIRQKYPDTKIGCLAYSEYIAPPTIKIEPNVYVAITTAFNNSSLSIEQLVDAWRAKGAMIGIYDYFSWYAWDMDIPGQSIASKPKELAANIRKYYKKKVSGYDGESSIGWVSKGLGYYIFSKLAWNVNVDIDAIENEFFENCFRKAASPMKKMWSDWETYSFTLPREGDLARWIDLSDEALRLETDNGVQKRLFQVRSYLHYLALFRNYQLSKTEDNLLTILSYGFRKLDDGSVSGYPAFFELGNRSNIPGMAWGADAKWRYNKNPVTETELAGLLKNDRAALKISEPVMKFTSSAKFRNAPPVANKTLVADSSSADNAFWMTNEWVLQVREKGKMNYIDFTGDYIGDKTNTKPIKITIYPYSASGDVSASTPLLSNDYTDQKVPRKISLENLAPGYYTMIIEDPVKIFRFTMSPSVNYSLVVRQGRELKTTTINYAFIYVPEGVKLFNVIKSRQVKFITPTGREINLDTDKQEDLQVEVKNGEAGIWRIKLVSDRFFMEGIPPYVGTSLRQMLIPQ